MFQIITSGKLYLLEDVQQKQTLIFHESAVNRTDCSSHEKNKKKLLLKLKANFVYHTFMVGIIRCLMSVNRRKICLHTCFSQLEKRGKNKVLELGLRQSCKVRPKLRRHSIKHLGKDVLTHF